MSDEHIDALRRTLIGDAEPLRQFGVALVDIPWWRRRIQRYITPTRYRLWVQHKVLDILEDES